SQELFQLQKAAGIKRCRLKKTLLKRNPYRLPLVGVEEGHRLEAKQLRHDQVGEGLDARRVLLHGAVVEAARVLQVVLDLDQLVGELAEIRVGLELHVDVGEALARLVAVGDQSVVDPGHGNEKQRNGRDDRGRHL